MIAVCCFFFQAEEGIRVYKVTGVQTCALPISAQRQYRRSPLLSGARAAHRARLHPGERRHRGHGLPCAGRAPLGPSPAGVRFPDPRQRAGARGSAARGRRITSRVAHMNDTATGSWKLERDSDDIAWLAIDKPGTSANVLSGGVLGELDALLAALEKDLPRGAVVISAKKSGFVAGADIKEFTGIRDAASGYQLIRRGQQGLPRLAALPRPTVAAIHGFALRGGFELALACRYRVAAADERPSPRLPVVRLAA